MMHCESAAPWLLQAADRGLSALGESDRERLAAHLAGCISCRRALEDQQAVRAVLAARVDADLPPGLTTRILTAVHASRSWSGAIRWRTWALRLAPVTAAFVLAALAAGSRAAAPAGALGSAGWSAAQDSFDGRPAFTLLGEANVSEGELLDAILSADPDDVLVMEDS